MFQLVPARALAVVVAASIAAAISASPASAQAHPAAGRANDASAANVVHATPARTDATLYAAAPQADSSVNDHGAWLAWDVTFDRYITAGLWNASSISAVAMAAYCIALVPEFARPACVLIANTSLFGDFRRLGPPYGRCLNISPALDIPPYRLRYVTCR